MIDQFPEDDEKLIAFLKQYHPVAPRSRIDAEDRLMELVSREPPSPPRHSHQFFWIVSSAMAGSLLLTVGGFRWLGSSPQMANSEEIETFIVENWHGAMEETPVATPTQITSDTDWLTLTEPEAKYVVSSP
jgi:hypothetical protein